MDLTYSCRPNSFKLVEYQPMRYSQRITVGITPVSVVSLAQSLTTSFKVVWSGGNGSEVFLSDRPCQRCQSSWPILPFLSRVIILETRPRNEAPRLFACYNNSQLCGVPQCCKLLGASIVDQFS